MAGEHAAALAGLDVVAGLEAADELARVDILRAAEPLEFVHPLLRAAVYAGLGRYERARTHARAARLLAAQDAPGEQVAAHLLHAAPAGDEEVVAALRRAAASALAHGVPGSAVAYLQRALREPPTPAVRGELLADLGRAELLAGRSDAVEHLRAAIELLDAPRRRAELWLDLARTLHDFGRLSDACASCERGLHELDDESELALKLQEWLLGSAMLLDERAADAHRRARAILANPQRSSTRARRALESKAMTVRLYAGGTEAGGTREELAALAARLFDGGRLLDQEGHSQAVGHIAIALSYCDDYERAAALLEAGRARAHRDGAVTVHASALQLLSRQKLWTGPLPDAVEDSRAAFEVFAGGLQMYLPASDYCLARALTESDRLDEAQDVLGCLDEGPAPTGLFAAWRLEAAGRLAAHRGDFAAARDAFLAAGERLAAVHVTNPSMFHWRSEAGLAALRAGDRELARRLVDDERALAERFGAPRAIGVARRAAGLLARGEEAVTLLHSAAELHALFRAHVEHARSLTELGGAVRRAGRPTQARATLRDAVALADRLGARAIARLAREQLVLAGGRPPVARDRTGELTPSERRVAALAASGHTNREIANALFITVKAVEWHLGNAYRKLDIRGRNELAGALSGPDGV